MPQVFEQTDRHAHVRFYHGVIRNQAKSEAAGRPIFDDKEMCEITFPGDRNRSVVAPAHEKAFMYRPGPGEEDGKGFLTYAERYPEQYKRFKANDPTAERSGTQLDAMPGMTPARVFELRAQNIHTVEALANLSEAATVKLHLRGERERAKAWLDNTAAAAIASAAVAEREALEQRFKALEAQMLAMKSPAASGPDGWTDEALRAFLSERGASPRANAAHDKLVAAVRDIMEQEAAFKAAQAEMAE